MIVKRRRKDKVKEEPYHGSTEVGMKVGMEDKSAAGWRQPITVKEPLKSGKIPIGQELGYHKGKDTEKKE